VRTVIRCKTVFGRVGGRRGKIKKTAHASKPSTPLLALRGGGGGGGEAPAEYTESLPLLSNVVSLYTCE